MARIGDKVRCLDQVIRNKSYFEAKGQELWLCSRYAGTGAMIRIEDGPCEIVKNIHYPANCVGWVERTFRLDQVIRAEKGPEGWTVKDMQPHLYARVVLPDGRIIVTSRWVKI